MYTQQPPFRKPKVYIYTYTNICIYTYVYIYIYDRLSTNDLNYTKGGSYNELICICMYIYIYILYI